MQSLSDPQLSALIAAMYGHLRTFRLHNVPGRTFSSIASGRVFRVSTGESLIDRGLLSIASDDTDDLHQYIVRLTDAGRAELEQRGYELTTADEQPVAPVADTVDEAIEVKVARADQGLVARLRVEAQHCRSLAATTGNAERRPMYEGFAALMTEAADALTGEDGMAAVLDRSGAGAAGARVRAFAAEWQSRQLRSRGMSDSIYGLGTDDGVLELTISDLSLVSGVRAQDVR